MPNLTREVFDATASTYDVDRSRLIPGCDSLYRWAIDLIPAHAKNILDLGAGSGLLTILIRNRFPDARIYAVDFSGAMLDLARQRMEGDSRVEFIQEDYVSGPLPQQMDAVVSSLSIHHLDDDDKRKVFRRAYQALAPGGVFINAEHIAGPTPELEQRYHALWLEQCRALGASEQQIADSLYRQQEDRRSSVEHQIRWMREAGFEDADFWYKENCFAVMSGTRR